MLDVGRELQYEVEKGGIISFCTEVKITWINNSWNWFWIRLSRFVLLAEVMYHKESPQALSAQLLDLLGPKYQNNGIGDLQVAPVDTPAVSARSGWWQ